MFTEAIRSIAEAALEEKRVDLVIGFVSGTTPFNVKPALAEDRLTAKKLIWNDFCIPSLAKHVLKQNKRMGIIANGCTSRTIMMYIMENQIAREDLYIIGVPCQGMIDRRKVKASVGKKKIGKITSEADRIVLSGATFKKEYPRHQLLCQNCLDCRHRNPVVYDVLAGELAAENKDIPDLDIQALEAQSTRERLSHFLSIFSRCTLCYACRDACPLCYCPTCFVDRPDTRWFGEPGTIPNPFFFHLLRAMHLAGRCTDCGACENACPKGIPLSILTRKLNRDIHALYQFEAGLDTETPLPLSVYNLEDRQDFILTEELRKTAKSSR